MNRSLLIVSVLFILSFGLVVTSQANSITQNGSTTYDTSKLIGLTVKSRDGVKLGQIFDLLADSNGHLDYAIVSQPGFEEFPGRLVVVPFGTLKISEAQSNQIRVVFNDSKEKFYEGPDYAAEDLSNLREAASIDRYYGIQPDWTEGGRKTEGRTTEDWMLRKILDGRRWDLWGEGPQGF